MLKGTLILFLAYVAAVSCAIIPTIDTNAETEVRGSHWGSGCGESLRIEC